MQLQSVHIGLTGELAVQTTTSEWCWLVMILRINNRAEVVILFRLSWKLLALCYLPFVLSCIHHQLIIRIIQHLCNSCKTLIVVHEMNG